MNDIQSFKHGLSLPLSCSQGEFCVAENIEVLFLAYDPAQHPTTETAQVTLGQLNIFGASDDAPQMLVSLQLLCNAMGTLCVNTSDSACAAALALCRILS